MLGAGVVLGIVGYFPAYAFGQSIAAANNQFVSHAVYLGAWSVAMALILSGGARLRAGALIALGTSAVTLGRFLDDLGWAGVNNLGRAGIVLVLVSWLACATGSVLALRVPTAGEPSSQPRLGSAGGVRRRVAGVMVPLLALGAAIAWAPSWDSIAPGLTCCNIFSEPPLARAGGVILMIAIVAVASAASLWRQVRLGGALLAGALAAMAAIAISAVIQAHDFGYGLTPAFWIYCVFVAALALSCVRMIVATPSAQAR